MPNSQTWHARSVEWREIARKLRNPQSRDRMMKVAEHYEFMASQAAERELTAGQRPCGAEPGRVLVQPAAWWDA